MLKTPLLAHQCLYFSGYQGELRSNRTAIVSQFAVESR